MKKTHGLSYAKNGAYSSWRKMRQRCLNVNCEAYSRYGGRGITICKRWDDFLMFLSDMGERPEGMSLDRIDVNGNYEPDNCRWATREEQSRNTRQLVWLTVNGERMTATECSRKMGISRDALRGRMKRGWSDHDAATRPPDIIASRQRNKRDGLE